MWTTSWFVTIIILFWFIGVALLAPKREERIFSKLYWRLIVGSTMMFIGYICILLAAKIFYGITIYSWFSNW